MKKILVVLVVLFSSICSYSQTENEYQERSFQGTEEQTYSPKEEVFLIYSGNISNKYMVFGELPNKNSYSITIDYEKNILTIKMGTTSESYRIEKEDNEYFWGDMPQYYLVKGYLFNKKNEKSSFIVEGGRNGSIIFTMDKNMKNRQDLYNAGLQNR
jgi:hypothetical protein